MNSPELMPRHPGLGHSQWDVVVVGAGPAGSTVAALLAEVGHSVILLDRARFPRRKPCGEAVNPGAVGELAALGVLDLVLALPHAVLTRWRIGAVGKGGFDGGFQPGVHGLGIDRAMLDAVLLERARAAGVSIRTGVRVVDLLRDGGRVCGVVTGAPGSEPIRARLVIGADGLRSIVVRRLGLIRRAPRLRKLALTAHVSGADPMGTTGELHLLPWGCVGIAPVADGILNVALVASGPIAGAIGRSRDAFFDDAVHRLPGLARSVRETPILATGPFDWPTRGAVADGALLVGDAAGYFDPFTGQGIFRALRGARMAADVADRCLRRGDLSRQALLPYERAHRRAFSAAEKLQKGIESVVSIPSRFALAAPVLRTWPALANRLVETTGDLRPVWRMLL
jgi:menaquinone-9 beta-reductase